VEVFVEVALERGRLGDQRAGECWPPAFLEDGELEALDAAVCVRSAGLDEALAGPELLDGVCEDSGAELGAVVAGDLAEFQPAALSSFAARWSSSRVDLAGGLRCEVLSSAQA
jgi:hypothetical protein